MNAKWTCLAGYKKHKIPYVIGFGEGVSFVPRYAVKSSQVAYKLMRNFNNRKGGFTPGVFGDMMFHTSEVTEVPYGCTLEELTYEKLGWDE